MEGKELKMKRYFVIIWVVGILLFSSSEVMAAEPIQVNAPPVACFVIEGEEYTKGQDIKVINKSYDPDGDLIVDVIWQTLGDVKISAPSIQALTEKLQGKSYVIGVKVKDNKGEWSEWQLHNLNLKENQQPVITRLETTQKEYKIGETIKIEYEYDNESWETIEEEMWSYRQVNNPEAKSIEEKPIKIFKAGEYEVTLNLKDCFGNWSLPKTYMITITEEVAQTELSYHFTQNIPGSIIRNEQQIEYRNYQEVPYEQSGVEKGTLIISNSPEIVKEKGILYRDIVKGKGRVVIHHLNGFTQQQLSKESKRLMVIAQNQTATPVKITISKRSVKGPDKNVLHAGQKSVQGYLESTMHIDYTIAPGEGVYIYDSKPSNWDSDTVITGMFNFETDGPLRLTVAVGGPKTEIEHLNNMVALNKDNHIRGTYDTLTRYYHIDATQLENSAKLLIGSDKEEWAVGYDAITGETVYNRGNYGIEHSLKVITKDPLGILLNARGGMYTGAIKWMDGRVVKTPKTSYFEYKDKAAVVGVMSQKQEGEYIYILPNGSSAPVLFGFLPQRQWNQ